MIEEIDESSTVTGTMLEVYRDANKKPKPPAEATFSSVGCLCSDSSHSRTTTYGVPQRTKLAVRSSGQQSRCPPGKLLKDRKKRGNIIKQRDTVRQHTVFSEKTEGNSIRSVLPSRQNDCNVCHKQEHDAAEWEKDFKRTEPFDTARPHKNHSQTKSETNTVGMREGKGLV